VTSVAFHGEKMAVLTSNLDHPHLSTVTLYNHFTKEESVSIKEILRGRNQLNIPKNMVPLEVEFGDGGITEVKLIFENGLQMVMNFKKPNILDKLVASPIENIVR
jgi:hypothetical protein